MAVKTLLTLEEFAQLSEDDGFRYELDEGELIKMSPPNFRHGALLLRIAHYLQTYLDIHRIGRLTADAGFILSRDPDTCRGPDIAFVSSARASRIDPDSWVELAPELAIEIVSPSNRPEQMKRKVRQYLNAGTEVVWVVYPKSRTVRVHDPSGRTQVLSTTDTLTASALLPGFKLQVEKIFEEL